VSDDISVTMSFRPAQPTAGGEERFYLIVVEGETSAMFHLPRNGVVLIGRGPEADLQLADQTVSRKHARIMITDGEARVADLDSHNGTRVNGDPISGAQTLVSGDVIGICSATLVLHSANRPPSGKLMLDRASLRRRLDEELERSLRYGRPLAVAAITIAPAVDRQKAAEGIAGALRLIDVAAWAGETQVIVMFPELDEEPARDAVQRLVAELRDAHAGLAAYPTDGCDGDTLLAAARAAASDAKPGQVLSAEDTASTISAGDREIIVADPAMARLYALIRRLAASDLPVLVLGETGAGKENAAFAVHAWSVRGKRPFVTLNCAAIQENLVESELFGHEKGAFSGAVATKVGLLESAHGGTVFLDEVGELSPAVQAKLLRVLEAKKLTRLGDVREREIDIRVVAATNRNLDEEVKHGRFRQDLFFRLSPATVVLPPLRERPREIPVLARAFLAAACAKANRAELPVSTEAMQRLAGYGWPGNVRELRNVIEYVSATIAEDQIEVWHLPERISGVGVTDEAVTAIPTGGPPAGAPKLRPIAEELRELERRRMVEALEAADGVQRKAAELIGMPLRTFVMKYKQYGLKKS
jgi:two-component system, NtrC family, response regulator AtoC